MKNKKYFAMVPARIGSTRLEKKNLALLNGKPLIAYAIEAAKSSGVFSRIVVNSDNEVFAKVAKRHDVEFYLRPAGLGSSKTKSDSVVYDFMSNYTSDIVAWVNPTSPLQTGDEIRNVVEFFIEQQLDSLITVKREYVHCVKDNIPINFNIKEQFSQTQNLKPVDAFVYSVMMWRRETFMQFYEKQGFAMLCGRVGYYPVSKQTALIIKNIDDLMLADYALRTKGSFRNYEIKYDNHDKK